MFKTSPVSRVQALALDIEQSISDQRLAPGDRIATMDDLRARTGLAKQTISEAARLLAERGTVEIRPGRGGGLFVAPVSPVVRLRHTLLTVPTGSSTVTDAIAVRGALEGLIDTDAARLRSPADIRDLRRELTKLRRAATSPGRFMPANWALHERIAQITANTLAQAVYLGMLSCIAELSTGATTDDHTDSGRYLQHRLQVHVDLVEAIIAGDLGGTTEAVRQHQALTERAPASQP
ncbi:MAG TPA: FCD domain-containing protein [Trebonia sp.]|nr:FCD domain-containing protein [Trebonia sp.]